MEYNVTINESVDSPVAMVPNNAAALQLTRFIVQRVLVPTVVLLGLTGNIISIVVLTHRSMKSSTNTYLAALAIFDTLYLLTSFTLSIKHYDDMSGVDAYQYWFPVGRIMTDLWGNVSVCLTVTFTIERYIAVCHPMKGRVICTPERARIIAVIVICFALVSTSPEFFEWKVTKIYANNSTRVKAVRTEFGSSSGYNVWYYWFIAIMFTFIPLIAICTFNWVLIRSVCKASKLRKRMTYVTVNRPGERHQGEQNRITMMLISVAIVFALCQFPSASMLVYNTYLEIAEVEPNREELNNLRIGGNVANLLVLVNAAINFLLYSVMSTKFRRVFLRLICRRCHGDKQAINFSEYSYVSGMTKTRRTSNYRSGYSNKILKDSSRSTSPGALLPHPHNNKQLGWSPALSMENLRCSSESLCSPPRTCNGNSSFELRNTVC